VDSPPDLWRSLPGSAPLGAGATGVVTRVRHAKTGQIAALKKIRIPHPSALDAFHREIQALSTLRHPGIAAILDHGVEDGCPWYVMELVEGPSLEQEALRHPMTWQEALAIVASLCDAVAHLHGAGLVHRDLKPGNVMLRATGEPVLVDFGLAVQAMGTAARDVLEVALDRVGTPAYMAPEQIRGEALDARADLYALGCMLYRLIVGRPPFVGSTRTLLGAHLTRLPEPPSALVPELPPGVDALLQRLLAKSPRERLGYAEDLAEELIGLGAPAEARVTRSRTRLHRPGFVGRDDALSELREALSRTFDRQGSARLLLGPSGIGKTRLLAELLRQARDEGVTPWTLAARPETRRVPLSALRELVRQLELTAVSLGDEDAREDLGKVEQLLGAPPSGEGWFPLYHTLTEIIRMLARSAPVLLAVDDAQWLDEVSFGFLAHLERQLAGTRCLVLVVVREGDEQPVLDRLQCAQVRLDELPLPALGAMVRDALGVEELQPEIEERLARAARGSPFFVAEQLRLGVDEGWLTRTGGRWQLAGGWQAPADPREVTARRLRCLPETARLVLSAAAVAQEASDAGLLAELTGLAPPAVHDAQQLLLTRRLLEEGGDRGLQIAHSQTAQAAYRALEDATRRRLHVAVAQRRELTMTPAETGVVALHWLRAGELARADRKLLAAASYASEQHALREAERLFRTWLQHFPEDHPERPWVFICLSIDVVSKLGPMDEALALFLSAQELAVARGDAWAELKARIGAGSIEVARGRVAEARAWFSSALPLARAQQRESEEAFTLNNLGVVASMEGRYGEAREMYEQALALHRKHGRTEYIASTLSELAVLAHKQGQREQARAAYEESAALAQQAGALAQEGITLGNLATLHAEEGELDLACACAERSLWLKRKVGDREGEMLTLGTLAKLHAELQQLPQARQEIEQALAILHELGAPRYRAPLWLDQAYVELAEGDRAGARALAERALAEGRDDEYTRTLVERCMAAIEGWTGEPRVAGD
jgi:tetratricopeptide (TPR) repeat protein/tRNA A-37 threonylcarbamoyl transferase component Bud32